MRPSILFSLLIVLSTAYSATAQNFQPFRNKFKYQFSYTGHIMNPVQSGLIHGIEVDSAKIIDSDSVFFFNKLATNTYDNFWGNSMVKKPGGEYLFLVKNYNQNDTVRVKTQEPLGTQWTFKLKNILYTIRYERYDLETVLQNQTDFVMTFFVENASGFKDSIKISKNFGLVYSFAFNNDFYTFNNTYYLHHTNFNLTYIFNLKIGENKINYFEYFNYDLGDIIEYTSNTGLPSDNPYHIGSDIYKVISKTTSSTGDTITYMFRKCHIDALNGKYYSTSQTHCELVVTACSVTGSFPYIGPLSFPTNKTGALFAFGPAIYNNDLIISPPFVSENFPVYIFQKNLGLKKYTYSPDYYHDYLYYVYTNLQYIKQSNINDDCDGLETILDTKTLHALSANLVVAPNPFDNEISLNATNLSQGNWTVRITSGLGVEVYNSTMVISSSDQKNDLSNLPALTSGIYFLSLENESQVYSQKIVKQ